MVTTNLSVDLHKNKIYQYLKEWKTVDWQISFDNAHREKFEYVRHGASWDQFVKNIQILKEDNQKVAAHPAYSIYCAYDLMDYYKFVVDHQLNLFWCMLSHPVELDVVHLSKPMRAAAAEEIDKVLAAYSGHRNLALDTLHRYKLMLLEPREFFHQVDPVQYHRTIETEFGKESKFEILWSPLVNMLNKYHYE